ncbi:MAG: DUF1049 domain-containing protein [Rhodospirillaceae bacterium]|jgi:uncharacterized integral membrane protein|nr:DUF1049 domain-containing protein [Rhodospirillaceae bacterium]MBT5458371.1 DUF1049 domain-containing protein [Rhodospirillaceae bacterium]
MVGILRFIVKALFTLIVVVFLVAAASFAVTNREPVAIHFLPFFDEVMLPLGTTVLAALGIGLVVGTALMSLSRLRLRRRARSSERRLAALERTSGHGTGARMPATGPTLSSSFPPPAARDN